MRSRGRTVWTLVEMALELRLNTRTRLSIVKLKQDWPSCGSKQWLLRLVPAAFNLFCSKADESRRNGPEYKGYDNIDQGIAA